LSRRPAVAARGLVCQFGPVRALENLSFEVAEGEVFGLLGPNGAGKTTAIRVVTTLLPPDAGTMEVFGLDTRRSTMRVRRLVGYVPQQLSIDGQLTGYENVWLFARLFDVPRRERRGRVEGALAQVGLERVGDGWPRPIPAGWSAAWSSPRPWSAGPASWSSTSPPSGSTPWPAPASGNGSWSCATRRT
jgi:ABC-type multidrug transport system ATPase subunit